jgi:hypothetical protein
MIDDTTEGSAVRYATRSIAWTMAGIYARQRALCNRIIEQREEIAALRKQLASKDRQFNLALRSLENMTKNA